MDTTRPIIALDFASVEEAYRFVDLFDEPLFVKVGMELFYNAGPQVVREVKARGHQVFCDLKLHDIPNTVGRAAAQLGRLGADLLTVHAAGGRAMMKAAREGVGESGGAIMAITQLTSTSEEAMRAEQLVSVPLVESVLNYARLAREAGLDGVVCSPLEAGAIRDATSDDFLRVTPGSGPRAPTSPTRAASRRPRRQPRSAPRRSWWAGRSLERSAPSRPTVPSAMPGPDERERPAPSCPNPPCQFITSELRTTIGH